MTQDKMPTRAEREEAARRVAMELPEETRLAVAAWVFYQLSEHLTGDTTYRGLVYDLLAFPEESGAYSVLQSAGALEVSNALDIAANGPLPTSDGPDE